MPYTLHRGFNWRDGHGQYSKETMRHALNQRYTWTKKQIDQQSSSSKFGRRVNFKVEFPELLRQNITYGDYSQGAKHEWIQYHDLDEGQGDGQWSMVKPRHNMAGDAPVEATVEVSNRMGDKIYGYQMPDMAEVTDIMQNEHNSLMVGGNNTGFNSFECGLWQAGHDRDNWAEGPQYESEFNSNPGIVTHDHVRATTIAEPLRSYRPEEMWIGSGHAPGSRRMQHIPFAV